jgi:hypothetical protein
VNPTNQQGSFITLFKTKGLSIGIISGKAVFNLSGKPKFKEAFIPTIFRNPCSVRCSLALIK